MIQNPEQWRCWERAYLKRTPVDFLQNLRLLEGMYREARALGHFQSRPTLDDLEPQLRMARALNVPRAA